MSRLGGTGVLVALLCFTLGGLVAPASATSPSFRARDIQGSDVSELGHVSLWLNSGDPWQVEISRSDAMDAEMAPFEPYVGDLGNIGNLPIAPGEVVCLRLTPIGVPDAPSHVACTTRPRPYQNFSVTGRARTFPAVPDYGVTTKSISLLRGGRLLVPHLRAGMHVGVLYGVASWRISDDFVGTPRWHDPNGVVGNVGFYWPDVGGDTTAYPVSAAGTGFFAGDKANTRPIASIVIYPEWFVFGATAYPPTSVTDPTIFNGGWVWQPPFRPDQRVSVSLYGPVPTGYRVELQTRTGSSLKHAPSWTTRSIPTYASSLMIPLRPGHTLCIRQRVISPAGMPGGWMPERCASRPFDDRWAVRSGRTKRTDYAYFADGRATLMLPGSKLTYRKRVFPGTRVGFAYTSPNGKVVLTSLTPEIYACHGRGFWGGVNTYGAVPSYESKRTVKRCLPEVRLDRGITRNWLVSAIIVIPPWSSSDSRAVD